MPLWLASQQGVWLENPRGEKAKEGRGSADDELIWEIPNKIAGSGALFGCLLILCLLASLAGVTVGLSPVQAQNPTWVTQTVDSTSNVVGFTQGWFNSLAFDNSGNPAISYQDLSNHD